MHQQETAAFFIAAAVSSVFYEKSSAKADYLHRSTAQNIDTGLHFV